MAPVCVRKGTRSLGYAVSGENLSEFLLLVWLHDPDSDELADFSREKPEPRLGDGRWVHKCIQCVRDGPRYVCDLRVGRKLARSKVVEDKTRGNGATARSPLRCDRVGSQSMKADWG